MSTARVLNRSRRDGVAWLAALVVIGASVASGNSPSSSEGTTGPVTARLVKAAPFPELMAGPDTPQQREAWLRAMRTWREEQRAALRKVRQELPDPYAERRLHWTQNNFVHTQMMAHDRYFYDPQTRRYTVDRYLDDLLQRYGGIDSVLIWPTYPNIGVDNRNQYDLWRDMPGGLEGVRGMVADFHRRGVRTFLPIMIWDTGTRDEGVSMPLGLAKLARDFGIDGLNGDTMRGVGREFYEAARGLGHPVALEPELNIEPDEALAWNTMSWGYWWPYESMPGVARYKWVEPRHMTHVTDRWAHSRNDMLQYAFFNGSGYNSWENVWSIWMGMTPRDGEALRRISAIYRAVPELLISPDWEPHVETLQPGVFASKFPGTTTTLWTVINRSDQALSGTQLRVEAAAGTRFLNLWDGTELDTVTERTGIDGVPGTTPNAATTFALSLNLEPRGFGAVLAVPGEASPAPAVQELMAAMKGRAGTRLADLSGDWKVLPQQMVETSETERVAEAPAGMIRIPGGRFVFEVEGVMIETHEGVDVQYPWEDKPALKHRHEMTVKPFHIDRCPVTCAEFQQFLDATGYRPADEHNFLRNWIGGRRHPEGWEKKPVTWISIEDARAYAAWAGKRLPHEWEWQLAAQGTDGRRFPWGNDDEGTTRTPPLESGREQRPPTDVDAYPAGASPYGVLDLVGNVWQWTDEFRDEHTRSAVVRGGSYYRPSGSHWYFPQARELNKHGKYLLMAPSLDRSATIGFRCVKDAL